VLRVLKVRLVLTVPVQSGLTLWVLTVLKVRLVLTVPVPWVLQLAR